MHLLIADEDLDLAETVGWYLQAEGVRVTVVQGAAQVRERLQADPPEALMLDLGLLGAEGAELIGMVRQAGEVPILGLAGKAGTLGSEAMQRLELDDWVAWPYGPMELVARLKPLLKRALLQRQATRQRLKLSLDRREALVDDQPVALSPIEFDLLAALVQSPGAVRSRDQLGDAIWGDDFYGDLRLVDSHIARLRAKLRAAGLRPVPVATVRGTGYVYRA